MQSVAGTRVASEALENKKIIKPPLYKIHHLESDMKKNKWIWFLGVAFLIFLATDRSVPAAVLLCFCGTCSAISAIGELVERKKNDN